MTTVQDLGRYGYQSQGFSVAGVMDVRSFKIANLLLDNPENEAVLEITLIGPTLEFTSATIIAITGGDFQPTINGEPAPMYTALYMNKGDVLKFGSARTGSRGYIAFSSYLDIPVVMGSRCTNLKSGLGGFKGRKLEADDYIGFRIKRRYLPFFLSRKLDMDEFDQTEATLRVVMGPQDGMFSKQGIQTFLGSEYTVTNEFDRMGCRLEGPFIAPKETSDIISDGIAFGAIQVPSHGKPIILLADRQTTGGYGKIATVASVDIPKLVQRKTDDKIHFKAITVQEAQALYVEEMKELDGLRKIIHQPCPKCGGKGMIRHRKTIKVSIPAGIDNGQTISLRAQGNAGKNGGPAGDLLIVVSVRPHEIFRREGTSVLCEAPITFTQAVLGAELEIPTIDGKVKYSIPEGTQSGTTFRLKGKGIPGLNGRARGDQYVTVYIETPRNLNREQKEALRKFSDTLGESNYEQRKSFFGKFKL